MYQRFILKVSSCGKCLHHPLGEVIKYEKKCTFSLKYFTRLRLGDAVNELEFEN